MANKPLIPMHIHNTTDHFNHSLIPLDKACQITEQQLGKKLAFTVSFVDTNTMFSMNNQLRSKPNPTDVLSVPSTQEIFLCPDYIYANGYDNDRILHLFVHALLHLNGYTHDATDDFNEMSALERKICLALDLKDPYP